MNKLAALKARHMRALLAQEKTLIREALAQADWCLETAARALGVTRSTMQHAMARHPTLEAARLEFADSPQIRGAQTRREAP
jgi:transcriptional regulator with GAF, ATPase, and Fis domain